MANVDVLRTRWRDLRDDIQRHWGRLSEPQIEAVRGDVDELVDLVQETYGYNRERARDEVDRFLDESRVRLDEARERVAETVQETVLEYPWRAVLAALFVGLALGLLFTHKE
jgi:ElaB/YqjD/DUF883 family membrane-anchored ribosome-binding protein